MSTVVTSYSGHTIATSSMPVFIERSRESDLCRCGHQRRAHESKRGRCFMSAWKRHQCQCSLFRRPR